MSRLDEIKQKLTALTDADSKPWKFNPKYEMFIGTTNAVEMYDSILDLGRGGKEYEAYQDETSSGYRLTRASVKRLARIKALGEFLESCREDMQWLIEQMEGK